MRPEQFVPWVEELLRGGHTVHVVYEACGFGFSLYRQLMAVGAHCYVIAPRKLDEECTRVKTDPRDATTFTMLTALLAVIARKTSLLGGACAVISVPVLFTLREFST